jgi:hypothetical protein
VCQPSPSLCLAVFVAREFSKIFLGWQPLQLVRTCERFRDQLSPSLNFGTTRMKSKSVSEMWMFELSYVAVWEDLIVFQMYMLNICKLLGVCLWNLVK